MFPGQTTHATHETCLTSLTNRGFCLEEALLTPKCTGGLQSLGWRTRDPSGRLPDILCGVIDL